MKPQEKIIVALDVNTEAEALKLVKKLSAHVGVFKVGKELFVSSGPSIIKKIHKLGGKVFLDLKFHDIPNTVAKAVDAACKLGVYMLTIHTSGGSEMMKAAADAAAPYKNRPIILGVTVLTSMDDKGLKEINVCKTAEAQVLRLAKMAKKAGLTGIVSSAMEAKKLRKALGPDMALVTPGIRPLWSVKGDQKRIVTPKDAIKNGSSFMVIGRPITGHKDPVEAAKLIAEEIK